MNIAFELLGVQQLLHYHHAQIAIGREVYVVALARIPINRPSTTSGINIYRLASPNAAHKHRLVFRPAHHRQHQSDRLD